MEEADEFGQAPTVVDEGSTNSAEPLLYGSVEEFMWEFLRHHYKRAINANSRVWDPRWFTSAEALCRLEALWRAFEHLRRDGKTGMSVWWRDYCDPTMAVLFSSDGPFQGSMTVSRRGDMLPLEPAPEGLFPDERMR